MRRTLLCMLFALLLAGCASYSGRGLVPGEADRAAVVARMGQPALEWTQADGTRVLAYPRGPFGVHTFMVQIGPDGKLRRIDNVLDEAHFAGIRPGMGEEDVLHALGPSAPEMTEYFRSRDELDWGWRYCDQWNQLARFYVLFDGASKAVRSTMTVREDQLGLCGGDDQGGCWCSH